jgi:hypothetical protein
MSAQDIQSIVNRLASDLDFWNLFQSDPDKALSGYHLTPAERASLEAMPVETIRIGAITPDGNGAAATPITPGNLIGIPVPPCNLADIPPRQPFRARFALVTGGILVLLLLIVCALAGSASARDILTRLVIRPVEVEPALTDEPAPTQSASNEAPI